MRTLGLLTVLMLAAPVAALSATPEPSPPARATAKAEVTPTKIVCREVAQTGTRFKRKACGRTADWKKYEEESERARKEMEGQGANTAPSG